MAFCIPKVLTDRFVEKLKTGEINPEKLSSMESVERREYFKGLFGEEMAPKVNSLFESKLLLKNQKLGITNWAKKVAGLTPEAKRDILSKVERLDKVLNPQEQAMFLEDLASQRLGFKVTEVEAKNISELAKKVAEVKDLMTERRTTLGEQTAGEAEYGKAITAFSNYVNNLKNPPMTFKGLGKMIAQRQLKKSALEIAGASKSLKATLDNSAIFRQGWKVLWTNPGIWAKNAIQSIRDIIDVLGEKEVMDQVKSDIVSRPNYDLMRKEKLAVSTIEEAFPTSLPNRIPLFGRVYNAAETAFTAFVYRTRADVFDKLVDTARKTGGDTKGLGRLVNTLTGRADLGKLEPSAQVINNVLFSPRLTWSHVQVFTQALVKSDKISPFARKQAAINLAKIIGGTATVLAIAEALQPGSVEKDPRSADFGKIRIGDTRFDVTGGMSSLFTLASRLATMSSKSSTTGRISKLNSGEYGSQTGMDVLVNFTQNKLSPAGSVIKDLLLGKDFQGNKPTVLGEAKNLFVPLPIVTYQELQSNPNSANILLSMIADGLGISTNTYSPTTNWSTTNSTELLQFKSKVGDKKFKEANDKYNLIFNEWYNKIKTDPRFTKLDNDTQQKVITNKKSELKDKVLLSYGFRYKKAKSKPTPKF